MELAQTKIINNGEFSGKKNVMKVMRIKLQNWHLMQKDDKKIHTRREL